MSACSKLSLFNYQKDSLIKKAERHRENGETSNAVLAYEKHLKNRLKQENLAGDENPNFYYILIGDTFREAGELTKALVAYEEAQKRKVKEKLVGDRFRLMAKSFEEINDFESAFEILKKHRELDPFSFDLALDLMHKRFVEVEKEKRDTK